MAIVELHNVGFAVGTTPILTGVDLVVGEGERVGVAGPNGSGKTTLLMTLATLLSPGSGTGTVLGASLGTTDVYGIRRDIGLSGHDPAVYDELSLEENLRHVARLAERTGRPPTTPVETVLSQVGLAGAAHRRAEAASEGMRRRTDLARLLMLAPRLVLLDEAHAGLDSDARIIVDEVCRRAVADGGAAVMVSHDREALANHTDRVVVLTGGRLNQ